METENYPPNKQKVKIPVWAVAVVAVVAILVFAVGLPAIQNGNTEPEIITVSTLQEIVNVSELSTYTAVYNGIA